MDQSVPNLATIYMPIRSWMKLIMRQIETEHPELLVFALEFGKIAESDFVYTLASTNINQSAPKLVNMCMTIRSHMSLIMGLIGPELSYLPLNLQKLLNLCQHSSIYKCGTISTKHSHNIYDNDKCWMSPIIGKI